MCADVSIAVKWSRRTVENVALNKSGCVWTGNRSDRAIWSRSNDHFVDLVETWIGNSTNSFQFAQTTDWLSGFKLGEHG